MPDPITALVVGGTQVVGGIMQSRAASKAAGAQTQAAEAGIEEQRRQFDAVQEILKPYVTAGTQAITGLQPYAAAGAPALEQQQAALGVEDEDPRGDARVVRAVGHLPGPAGQGEWQQRRRVGERLVALRKE